MSAASERKLCLLVVDDEPDVCDSVHDLLRKEFRVLKAHNADEGYRLLQEEDVHIIMTDQRMPRISGVELLTSAKSRKPSAVRMLFTGYADLESIVSAINQGQVFQFLRKPWNPDELLVAVREAASEYERKERELEAAARLRDLVDDLERRVAMLEDLVRNLGGSPSGTWPAASIERP
ncbi:MAG: response regulator [Isosphaeraceae bacterium]|nr:response regulator [Isosphaeraceae bacterium]